MISKPQFSIMKTLFRFIAAIMLLCFLNTACIMGGSGDENNDSGSQTDPTPKRTDQDPKPPDPSTPDVNPSFSDTVQIN